MAQMKLDAFANVAYGEVVMSAPNTLTFSQIQIAAGIFQGVAMVIHRLKWFPASTSLKELVANTDNLVMCLSTSQRLTTIGIASDPAIIGTHLIQCLGANVEIMHAPIIDDFTTLPGGGKIVPTNPLFIGANSGGFVGPATIRIEIEFTFKHLADKDYIELIQSQLPANI